MVLIVVARDVVVTGARFLMPAGSPDVAAKASGKQKTVLQMLFIIAVLLYLIARQYPEWQPAWNDRALFIARVAMSFIVAVTVWSGLKALPKKS